MGSAQANTAPGHIALDQKEAFVFEFILFWEVTLTVGVCGGGAECVYNCVRSVNNMEINVANIFIFAI